MMCATRVHCTCVFNNLVTMRNILCATKGTIFVIIFGIIRINKNLSVTM